MRRCCLLLVFVGTALPTLAAKRVTVEQLEQTLAAAHGKSDAAIARQLSDLELTERLNNAKLAELDAELPGAQARQALTLLADSASFLDLPAAELPQTPAPQVSEQRQIIARTVTYVSQTVRRLPNFSATRVTSHFQDTPQGYEKGGMVFVAAEPLQFVARSSANVLYRDGGEVVDVAAAKGKKDEVPQGLTTSGEFGPILVTMLIDAAHGKLAWSHWEQRDAAPVAVFRYSVAKDQSHYEVSYCCVAEAGTSLAELRPFHEVAGYHGEFAVDPKSGTVLRVTLKADLKPTDPINIADMMVDYGMVEIGGKPYVCPVKSVSISRAVAQVEQSVLVGSRRGGALQTAVQYAPGHLQTLLNEVAFEQYHLFRADARMLADADNPEPKSEVSSGAGSGTVSIPSQNHTQVADSLDSSGSVAAPTETSAADAPPDLPKPAPVSPAPALTPAFLGPPGAAEVPVFKARSEAVVVDVVVTRGNDQPIQDLRKEDFQLIEDGQPQRVDLFEKHAPTDAPARPLPPMPANVFTNQPAAPPGDSVNVLLLDSLNTPKPDQAFVHQEILDFLKNMQPGTRMAIFALGSKLRYIQGFTDDPAVLRAALKDQKLMKPENSPASRTHQDDVDDSNQIKTMEMINGGHITAGIEAVQQAQTDFAGYQGGEAVQMTLAALRHLALYLAGVPGRKNLIWFSSTFPVTIFPSEKENQSSIAQRTYVQQIRDTADLLTLSKVAIYPVGAEGMMMNHTVEMQADMAEPIKASPMGAKSDQMADYSDQNSARAGTMAAMEQLASDTGGEAIFNTNDLNKAIARVTQNGSHYYTLVYTPTNKTMDGKYRRIEVRLNGGRYKLAYRHGYYADLPAQSGPADEDSAEFDPLRPDLPDQSEPADEDSPEFDPLRPDLPDQSEPADEDNAEFDPLRPLLAYGMPGATQLLYGVRVSPAPVQPDAKAERVGGNTALAGTATRYTLDFMIRWTDVDFDTTAKGTHAGKIQVGAIAYDRDGKPLNWIGTKQLMNLNEATYAAIQRSGISASLQIDVPPGAFYLATGIYDWGSKKAGTLEVPLASLAQPITAKLEENHKK